jgi:hypothetical protein
MRHPLQAIPPANRKKWFWSLLIATLAWMALMQIVNLPLITPAAPQGIISFELAGRPASAAAMLASWTPLAQKYAALGLGLDYIFMLLYATTIALACLWAGDVLQRGGWPGGRLGVGLAWGQWIAAALDALENLALALILLDHPTAPWAAIARVCAALKFALIFLGLVYAFLGLLAHLSHRRQRPPAARL